MLYSDQDVPESVEMDRKLTALLDTDRPRIGYIPSCADPGRVFFERCRRYYARLGAILDPYFELDQDYQPGLLPQLLEADAIHLSGGDTFYFLDWLRARGLIPILRDYAAGGGILIGVSAGSILMTADVLTAELCGDVAPSPTFDPSALGLVDLAFVPHWRLDRDPTPLLSCSARHGVPVYGCPDDAGIIVHDEIIEWVGELVKVEDAQVIRWP